MVISWRCLLVAVVLWPMCCHTGMPCHTGHDTPPFHSIPKIALSGASKLASTYFSLFNISVHGLFTEIQTLDSDLSLCYPLMWNVTLENTATHFNVFGKTQSWNPSLPHTSANAKLDTDMVVVSRKLVSTVLTGSSIHCTICSPIAASIIAMSRQRLLWIGLIN